MAKFLKLFVVIFFLFFSTAISYGQAQDQPKPTWTQVRVESLGSMVSGAIYRDNNKFVLDANYNYDFSRTATVCLGKNFGSDKFSVIPEVCGLFGLYNGMGPKVWFYSDTNGHFFEAYLQYAKMDKDSSFAYAWLQAEKKVGYGIRLGIASQSLKEDASRSFKTDIGPSISMVLRKHVTLSFAPLFSTNSGKVTPYARIAYDF
jgi:hypothetical protein